MEVVVSLSQGRTAAAQCGLFTHKSVPVIFEPPCIYEIPANNGSFLNAIPIRYFFFSFGSFSASQLGITHFLSRDCDKCDSSN